MTATTIQDSATYVLAAEVVRVARQQVPKTWSANRKSKVRGLVRSYSTLRNQGFDHNQAIASACYGSQPVVQHEFRKLMRSAHKKARLNLGVKS